MSGAPRTRLIRSPCTRRPAALVFRRAQSGRLREGPPGATEASAVQSIYQAGVPHTDAQGNIRTRRDSASFFPRCIYHALPGSFTAIKAAGFNCVHTWEDFGGRARLHSQSGLDDGWPIACSRDAKVPSVGHL